MAPQVVEHPRGRVRKLVRSSRTMSTVADAARPSARPVPRAPRPMPSHPPHRRHRLHAQALPARSQCARGLVAAQTRPACLGALRGRGAKGKPAHCTCPDHERSGWTCKHLGALLALGLLPAPKPASAKSKRLHAKNARLAIAEAKALPKEARQHLAEIAPPAPAPSLPEGWQPGGDYASFAAGFRQAVGATSPASAAAAMKSAMGAGSTSTRTRPAIPTCAMAAPGMVFHEHVTTNSC